jgi:hypothetical protein
VNEKKQFWQTEVGRIILLTVAVLLAGMVYDVYRRSNTGPYFSTDESIQWSKDRNEEMECMAEILGTRASADLESFGDDEKIRWGTEIRRRCENIDCFARADANSQRVFGKRLDEWDDATRDNVLVEHCWRTGIPGNWRRLVEPG